jgi:type I restriction enzyme, S subunit
VSDRRLKPGWRWVKFGDVVRLRKDKCSEPLAAGIERYIGLEHVDPADLRVRSWGDVADGTTFTNRVRPGQVLFGKRRAYQKKIAVADFDAVCSGDIYVLEAADPAQLMPELLPFICRTDSFVEHAVGTSAGSLSPRTNWSSLATYDLALPPLEEQRRVAPAVITAADVLERLRAAKREARRVYQGALEASFSRPLPGDGISPEAWAVQDWPLMRLAELVDADAPVTYGIVQVGDSVEGGVPTATSDALNHAFRGGIHFTSPRIESVYTRSRIRPKDILITVKGFGTGKIGLVPESFNGNINRDVARVRLSDSTVARLFVHLWKSARFERYWRALSVGTTRPELSIGRLRLMLVPWPAAAMRSALVDRLDTVQSAVHALEGRQNIAAQVLASLIETAFRWERGPAL